MPCPNDVTARSSSVKLVSAKPIPAVSPGSSIPVSSKKPNAHAPFKKLVLPIF